MLTSMRQLLREHLSGRLHKGRELWALRYCGLICAWTMPFGIAAEKLKSLLTYPGEWWLLPTELAIVAGLFSVRLLPGFHLVSKILIYGAATFMYDAVMSPSIGDLLTVPSAFGFMLYVFSLGPAPNAPLRSLPKPRRRQKKKQR